MAYNDQHHRRNISSPPQAIPLQDLTSPSSSEDGTRPSSSGRIRAISDRGREWGRQRLSHGGGGYSPLAEREMSPPTASRGPHLAIPQDGSGARAGPDTSPTSPVDGAALQEAFAGLTFGPPIAHSGPSFTPPRARDQTVPSFRTMPDTDSIDQDLDQDELEPFPSIPLDTTPLTHPRHLQPIAGAETPTGQRHDRSERRPSVRFSNVPLSPSTSRLGDDLNHAEAGLSSGVDIRRSGSLRRNLSVNAAGSTLQRAGTMVRNMSTRIVNLSNEQDVAARTMRRKSSAARTSRLEAPPEMPEMPQINIETVDGMSEEAPPSEKGPTIKEVPALPPERLPNPLRGKSLGIFPRDSKIRLKLCDILTHPATEPIILVLIIFQTIILTIDAVPNVNDPNHSRSQSWGTALDWSLLVLFTIYTLEIAARIIVSGFVMNPIEYSTINRQLGFRRAVMDKLRGYMGGPLPSKPQTGLSSPPTFEPQQPSLLRSFTTNLAVEPMGNSRYQRRVRLAHRAFLRHSFNRLDFIAVVSFWISFFLAIFQVQNQHELYVFKMLSSLRILKLLYITSGTTVILRSLKKAAPLLVNVAILIGFFWLLFAIIGVQAFKSSLRRECFWTDPTNPNNNYSTFQFCGGWLNTSGDPQPWVLPDGVTPGASSHKGYLCPINSICMQQQGYYNGTVTFDNIFQSLELVFVIMSSNTFSDLLYFTTYTDYLIAALFFAAGIVILYFWLISLLIAVITSSFQVIREEGKASAFTGEEQDTDLTDESPPDSPKRRPNPLKRIYDNSQVFWLVVIAFGLVVQCMRSSTMGPDREQFINDTETVVTFLLFLEICIRFTVDWRGFFRSKRNIADLVLAVITCIIQIPPIHNSGQPYDWLSLFQILRIYRLVMALPITRDLILTVLGNVKSLANLILFVFLLTFLASILAAQMFRGTVPLQDWQGNNIRTTFQTIWNSFLGMYQVFSSENWTDVMYHVTEYTVDFNTAWMGAAFFILWFLLANFIVLNMFIAVIQENFDVSEDEKRMQQVRAFLEQKDGGMSANGNLSLSSIFRFGLASGRRRDPLAFGTATTELLLKDAVVRDFLDQDQQDDVPGARSPDLDEQPALRAAPTSAPVRAGLLSSWWGSFMNLFKAREPNPFYSRLEFSKAYEDLDPRSMAKEVMSARERQKRAQRDYLRRHPNYNVSLYIFKPDNPIRRLCQRIVGPGRGSVRIEGVAPSVPVWYAFSAFIYAAIVAMVLLACITTPLYQKEYFTTHTFSVMNWFVWSDLGFAILFSIEALIKVIADGFFFTPNAYFRSSWGFIDGIVLLTLWINISTALANKGEVSRTIGAFKALRALRLLNVSDSARNNFHAVIIRGGWKVFSAAFVSLSLLIPFAIYGLNLFVGKMLMCNDTATSWLNPGSLEDCVDEFTGSPFQWNVWSPRQVSNSYFSFDNFGDSLFILFQIVSQEGWIDVMWRAQSITGVFTQPQEFSSQGYAVFFVIYNLLGAIFVLTLFVSVFMRNYTEQTGVAYLTADQRAWLELRKLLRQISPSKRPILKSQRKGWQQWCYLRAVRKTGRWQRFVTGALIFHLTLLCLEWYPEVAWWDRIRDGLFLLLSFIYLANIFIRIVGLTWARFSRSSWDLYSLISVSGTFVTTILALAMQDIFVVTRVHGVFLVSIAFLLIPRNNQLDQLFKTGAASLPMILNLMATWFVLFLTFAIAMTQTFGLTRFNSNETANLNFRDVPKALILLFRMSVGEGWNQIMNDFATVTPPLCVNDGTFDNDCGSPQWAWALFVMWNLLSMYIFVNLFISLIYESFSYVYQRSSGLSVVSREEIRRFKQAWAEFDPNGTGYIPKEAFPRLLGELSGVFEMRIYDGDFTVARLIEDCSRVKRVSGLPVEGPEEEREIDLKKLNKRLAELPVKEIRRRRARMNKFYEEVLVSSDHDRGIQFTSLLMILAHYKVINDNKSLRLNEFLRRRARLQRVDEAVRRNIVIGFFDTVYWSRRFRHHMERRSAGIMTAVPQFTVPEIFVEHEEDQAGASPRPDHLSPQTPISPRTSAYGAVTPPEGRSRAPTLRRGESTSSIQLSPTTSPHRSPPSFLVRQESGGSDTGDNRRLGQGIGRSVSPLDVDEPSGGRNRAASNVSAQDVLEVLDNSAWGESIRRSFSMRRPSQDHRRD